jgi:hypothetical protein
MEQQRQSVVEHGEGAGGDGARWAMTAVPGVEVRVSELSGGLIIGGCREEVGSGDGLTAGRRGSGGAASAAGGRG